MSALAPLDAGTARPRRRGLTWLHRTSAAVLAVALAGCAGQPGAAPVAPAGASTSPAPAPLSAQEQAEADLVQLVRDYYQQMNELYADPSLPLDALGRYTSGQLLQYRLLMHTQDRNSGEAITGGDGLQPRDIEVLAVDLAAGPPTAALRACSGGTWTYTGVDGSANTFTQPMTTVTYAAQRVSVEGGANGWRLMTSEVGPPC
jgi:hypothetical protein